jgi:hypothetical protein
MNIFQLGIFKINSLFVAHFNVKLAKYRLYYFL